MSQTLEESTQMEENSAEMEGLTLDEGNNSEEIVQAPQISSISSELPSNGELLDSLVLSVWGNIVGPEAVFTWKRSATSGSDNERLHSAIKYTVSHTLHAELGKTNTGLIRKARGHELYLVEDADFIVCSVPFTANCGKRAKNHLFTSHLLPHSLALILSGFHVKRFRDLQPMIHLYMQRFACCVRAYLHKEDYSAAVAELSPAVEQFCSNLASLSRTSNYLSAFHEVGVHKTDFQPILDLAITSHLQTCGCSVVIGDSVKEINSMINILAQFLQTKERCRVRYASTYDSPPYHPGILIQGMIKNSNGEVNILTKDILCNVLPTTVVDLSQRQVLRSWLLHEHVRQRQMQFKRELIALLYGHKPSPALTDFATPSVNEANSVTFEGIGERMFCQILDCCSWNPLKRDQRWYLRMCELSARERANFLSLNIFAVVWNVFHKATEPSRLVANFTQRIWSVEADPVQRKVLTTLFCKQLDYHALALIKQVNANYNREPSSADCPRQVDRKRLMKKLDLMEDSDFLVILATAEKLQQGIYHVLMNDADFNVKL